MKAQITIAIKFISYRDIDVQRKMYSKSGNIEVMVYDKAGEVIEEIFESFLSRYQIILET